MTTGVYRIQIGDHHYYGSAVNIEKRLINHRSDLRRSKHSNPHMQNVWNTYQTFHYEVVLVCEPETLLKNEQRFLDLYFGTKGCLNIRQVADNRLGNRPSEETRHRMSEAQKGKTVSPETRQKISEVQRGKLLTDDHKRNISKGLSGRTLSPEVRDSISKGARNRSLDGRLNISEAKRGSRNPMFGKPVSPETRQKRSESMKAAIARRKTAGLSWPISG